MIEIITGVNTATWGDPSLPLEIILTNISTRLDVLVPGPQGASNFINLVLGEIPAGAINGTNQTFTTAFAFIFLWVWLNGVRMVLNTDFTITGASTIHFNYAPATGDVLTVDYTH